MSEDRWPGFMKASRAPRMQKSAFHTIFHVLDAKGAFDDNPANAQARDEQGNSTYVPAKYPRMFYHPHGEEVVTVPGEWVEQSGGRGPKLIGEQRAIITALARNEEQEQQLRGEGWHDHPSKAIAEATKNPNSPWYGKKPPPMGADAKIRNLEEEVETLKRALAEAQAAPTPKRALVGGKELQSAL